MPKDSNIKKVLVIGSGPIIIGQAAEFDYAGTQCCRALREEGVEVVLVNSNPATIMTDKEIADRVYIEPLTADTVRDVIRKERPDSVLGTLGGQTGLNLCMELAEDGFLRAHGVRMIGTGLDAIRRAEDRLLFKQTMEGIGQPCVESVVVSNVADTVGFADKVGYPLIVRPAYTLGGTGGGIAPDEKTLTEITQGGLRASRVSQVLIEKSIAGWKEIEFEVIRDGGGNRITVCGMENIDPVGVHTGDSVVVAPIQTLGGPEFRMLRQAAFDIIEALGIEGGCNVQFALNPDSFQYAVIEVNPRLSRSSALASKAAGFPIAKVATKIALGYRLDEIENSVTKTTYASFEPSIDYCCVKIPKWPFDKFVTAKRTLGTQMKATGEVMSISPSFEAALMKAIRSLEQGLDSLQMPGFSSLTDEQLSDRLSVVDDKRLFAIAEWFRRQDLSDLPPLLDHAFKITQIDRWFLSKIASIVSMEAAVRNTPFTPDLLLAAKKLGFPDTLIARLTKQTVKEVREARKKHGILPGYRMVDTCAGEFAAKTPYYYSAYGVENESLEHGRRCVVVLGSGPIRIGQGIEFDYCSVHSVWALRQAGIETVIINNNPETVSTDFDVADRLYFEPLTPEDVLGVLDIEKPVGVMVQFGGQTAIKLAEPLDKLGIPILGTPFSGVDGAEDRKVFDRILEEHNIERPRGAAVLSREEALDTARTLGYPVLVRPSYVLGGQSMMIVFSDEELNDWLDQFAPDDGRPVLIDQYIMGLEVEVDAVCDGTDVLIPGIMEHLERAGVHSGDSISVYPPERVPWARRETLLNVTRQLALALDVRGLINIQFILHGGKVYVIEANPRSSRTVPYISKITGVPIVDLATQAALGKKLPDLGYSYGIVPEKRHIAVKMPVFSFEKLYGAEISLGPEMKSTGEVLGIADNLPDALMKAFIGGGYLKTVTRRVIMTVSDGDKEELCALARRFQAVGYEIFATGGTCDALINHGIRASLIRKIDAGDPSAQQEEDILSFIRSKSVDLVINTSTGGARSRRDGFLIRRLAVESGIPCLTSLDTAEALLRSLEHSNPGRLDVVDITAI
ncbi:MAG: carbamoyl-phosphate synthase large subunit [Oscillospiraceae bacterium]|jgi:carbamoyl-phosphate synthase large subunit|nr:carbamoyl-phosphate synthase large subunit [Oscillospiraceae bacterium]